MSEDQQKILQETISKAFESAETKYANRFILNATNENEELRIILGESFGDSSIKIVSSVVMNMKIAKGLASLLVSMINQFDETTNKPDVNPNKLN